jgi:hypothetical protein
MMSGGVKERIDRYLMLTVGSVILGFLLTLIGTLGGMALRKWDVGEHEPEDDKVEPPLIFISGAIATLLCVGWLLGYRIVEP